MEIFYIFAMLLIFLVIYMVVETKLLVITHHVFKTRKLHNKGSVKFLHFTDLHLGRTGIKNYKIINSVKDNPSDFLVFTGDYFEKYSHIPRLINLIREIRSFYFSPIYLCFGNHDHKDVFNKNPGSYEDAVRQLKELNITVLENQSSGYIKGAISLCIIGLKDVRSNKSDIKKIIADNRSSNEYIVNLLITHNSDLLMKMESASVDIAVAGHTHGAQIWSPFNIETKLLHRKDILSSRYNIIRGYYKYNEIDLYISRGMGCSTIPIRFLSKPEIVSYTIEG